MPRTRQTPTGERPVESGPAPEAPPKPEVAAEDVLIARVDIGPGAHTLVAAGDPIPAELVGLPRQPRNPKKGRG